MPVAPPTLAQLLRQLITTYGGSQRAFAQAVGLSSSNLSHLLSGDPHYSLGVEPCLRIAQVTESSPARLLRAAGKGHVAETLAQLYGAPSAVRAPKLPATLSL